MGCEYAFDSGRSKAIQQFHKAVNELLQESTDKKAKELPMPDYWREIGKQDVLLMLLGFINELIVSKY
jgi:hypothetical protein